MKDAAPIPQTDLRPPDQVMRLARMGAMFPTRLSFLRSLIRRLADDRVTLSRPVWQMDKAGFGHAVYTLRLGGHDYALVAVSSDLPADQRTDRVIATAWDSAFVLYDGIPDRAEIDRIVATAPRQEAARFTARDLVLSRANKSLRLFAHVTQALREGRRPDVEMVRDIGYLMRTTAVYGNGKFGIADRHLIATRPGLEGPFGAEMLTVWLIRHFTHDLAEHVGGGRLDRAVKRHLGIGNATGLGMAPFLVTHPVLLNNWMMARETALARVRAIARLTPDQQARLQALAARAAGHLRDWQVPDPAHQARIVALRGDWAAAQQALDFTRPHPLDRAMHGVAHASLDLQELMAALIIEPFGDLVDDLVGTMSAPAGPVPAPMPDTADMRDRIERQWDWALQPDYEAPAACARFWYISAAKREPRLGCRLSDPGAELETPLDIGRRIKALHAALKAPDAALHDVLTRHPEHALAAERVALTARYPYGEIRDNLIAADCQPIDMLRCKLSFFGATRFDPKSDRWTRITLCQGAPLADELGPGADDWWLPVFAP
ncbi:hypothetical protein FIU94_09570 [Sulfitobacter sp. THAF37]|uniref:hypothetical protein n=1 Tax=Sulfitobacter sp. THAF37 TaxID=2587855 RepID=UPI0012687272|nr:hypothetical protein [Sulfitobacter sp. THAF37]QFT59072.1 hypothetical protein FIU94_09570 [Sulfitobacter sp. THAF37]